MEGGGGKEVGRRPRGRGGDGEREVEQLWAPFEVERFWSEAGAREEGGRSEKATWVFVVLACSGQSVPPPHPFHSPA